ncbi:hypothetical protein AAVH_34327, partial [Aphelenchoides avenae]
APAIVVTRSEFAWMVRWEMLRIQTLTIASKNVVQWHSLIEHFQMPSLRVLRCTRPSRRRQPRNPTDSSSVALVADIIKLNSNRIEELDRVPVWKLSEPLPPIRLKKFVYEPCGLDHERLDNLFRCTIDVLDVFTKRPGRQVALDVLAGVDANEIAFPQGRAGIGHFTATEGTTNERVRRISFRRALFNVSDLQRFRRFFPNLAEIRIDHGICSYNREQPGPYLRDMHEIGEYLASAPAMPVLYGEVDLSLQDMPGVTHSWTEENVRHEFGRLHEMREALTLVPPQLEVSSRIFTEFHYVGESQTKKADILANQLGLRPRHAVDYRHHEYELEIELAPGRELCLIWSVI